MYRHIVLSAACSITREGSRCHAMVTSSKAKVCCWLPLPPPGYLLVSVLGARTTCQRIHNTVLGICHVTPLTQRLQDIAEAGGTGIPMRNSS